MATMKLPHKPTLLLLILGLVACVLSSQNCTRKNGTLFIQGFVPGENPVYSSPNIVPAATVAVNEINCNQSLLPNYHIELNFSDTKVSSLPLGPWQHKGSGIQKWYACLILWVYCWCLSGCWCYITWYFPSWYQLIFQFGFVTDWLIYTLSPFSFFCVPPSQIFPLTSPPSFPLSFHSIPLLFLSLFSSLLSPLFLPLSPLLSPLLLSCPLPSSLLSTLFSPPLLLISSPLLLPFPPLSSPSLCSPPLSHTVWCLWGNMAADSGCPEPAH